MTNVSPDMYVGIEIKCNRYIIEINRFMNENHGVVYQNVLNTRIQEVCELIGELRILIKGLREKSPSLKSMKT